MTGISEIITDHRNIFLRYWSVTHYAEWSHKASLAPRLNKTTDCSYQTQAEIVSRQTWFPFPSHPKSRAGKSIGESGPWKLPEFLVCPWHKTSRKQPGESAEDNTYTSADFLGANLLRTKENEQGKWVNRYLQITTPEIPRLRISQPLPGFRILHQRQWGSVWLGVLK